MAQPRGKTTKKKAKKPRKRLAASYNCKTRKPVTRRLTLQKKKRHQPKEVFNVRGYEPYIYKRGRRRGYSDELSDDGDDDRTPDGAESLRDTAFSEDSARSYDTVESTADGREDTTTSNNKGKGKMSDSNHSSNRSGFTHRMPVAEDAKETDPLNGSNKSFDQTGHNEEKQTDKPAGQEKSGEHEGDEAYESDESVSYSTS